VRLIKTFSLASLCIITGVFSARLSAQSAGEDNAGSKLTTDAETGVFLYSYWGVSGRTYFLQHSDDLLQWNFLPIIEQGFDEVTRYALMPSIGWTKLFLRLRHTDAATGGDPYAADFDADGIPNGFEVEHGLNPFNAADASAVVNGLTNLELYHQSLGAGADPTQVNPLGLMIYTP
jgi:hypothetical protein